MLADCHLEGRHAGDMVGGGRNAPYQLDKGYCGTVSLPVDHVFCRLLFNLKLARMYV